MQKRYKKLFTLDEETHTLFNKLKEQVCDEHDNPLTDQQLLKEAFNALYAVLLIINERTDLIDNPESHALMPELPNVDINH
jgi:hypothetical protein